MKTAREVFEHIAATLNNDAEDGVMSTTIDDELVFYLLQWQVEILENSKIQNKG